MKDKMDQLEWLALRLVLEENGIKDWDLVRKMSQVYNTDGRVMDLNDYSQVKKNMLHVFDYKEGRVYLK